MVIVIIIIIIIILKGENCVCVCVCVCYLNAIQCCSYQHMISVYPLSFGCVPIYLGGTKLFKF